MSGPLATLPNGHGHMHVGHYASTRINQHVVCDGDHTM